MIHYHRLGSVPPKHHVTHYEDGKLLMEQCMIRVGFASISRICVRPIRALEASPSAIRPGARTYLFEPGHLSVQPSDPRVALGACPGELG
jgi:hypothetical protein